MTNFLVVTEKENCILGRFLPGIYKGLDCCRQAGNCCFVIQVAGADKSPGSFNARVKGNKIPYLDASFLSPLYRGGPVIQPHFHGRC